MVPRRARPSARTSLLPAVLAALVLLATLAGCASGSSSEAQPIPATPNGPRIGAIANVLQGGPTYADDARRLGVGWLREEVDWTRLEPRRGTLRWAPLDRTFLIAAQRGLRILPLLRGTPAWMTGDPGALPLRDGRWAAFVAAAVARYGTGGTFWKAHPTLDPSLAPITWEVWNEPYLRSGTGGRAPDPVRYAWLVRAAVDAGRAVDPRAEFLMAAEEVYARRDGSIGNWTRDVLDAAGPAGTGAAAAAVHPYTQDPPTQAAAGDPYAFGRIARIRDLLRARGASDRLWITEIGFSTCRGNRDCVSERRQADYLRDVTWLTGAGSGSGVEAVFFFHLTDYPNQPRDPQAHFGLLRVDGTRKPAWTVVAQAARVARR